MRLITFSDKPVKVLFFIFYQVQQYRRGTYNKIRWALCHYASISLKLIFTPFLNRLDRQIFHNNGNGTIRICIMTCFL